jgi:APA family basic amino acid/polyamine antiporter
MPQNKLDAAVQSIIPPALVLLLTVTIIELFYDVAKYSTLIDIFDLFIITIFAIDLRFRWKELPHFVPFVKKYYLDIIATIPFNFIFLGIEYLALTRALRGVRIISRIAKLARYSRLIRLLRFAARAPRFLRMRHHLKPTTIRKVQPHEKKMKGVLSFKVILLVTINSIMGTGIWFLTAAGAKYAGPASLISWLILSIIAVYIAMCFSELTSMFPKAGGVYEFAKQTYGRFWSFVIGWTTSIAGSVTISMLLLGALQYMIPIEYSAFYIPIAIGLVLLFNYIAYRGMQSSTYMLVTFALITIATVTSIIVPGFFRFNAANFTPFFVFPAMNLLLAIFFIAETFFGWESAIFLSAETKNPTKVMPKALIYGTLAIAAFAFLLTLTALGVIPWQTYAESIAPLRDLGIAYFGGIGGILFTVLVSTSIIGAVASWIVTAPRLLMALAEDKLFFVQLGKIHPKHKSPYVSIIFQILIVSVLVIIGAGSYETLLHLLIPLILVLYSAVLLSVVILRFKKPNLPRPYRAPFGKVGPFFTVLFMVFLLAMFIQETHGAMDLLRVSASLIIFGIPAYFAIEIFYDQKYVNMRKNMIAWFSHYYHSIPSPKPLFNYILRLVGGTNKDSLILDYDCGAGGFTRRIIKKKLPFKKIYAVDKAKEEIKLFKDKLPKEHKNVSIYYRTSWKIPKKIRNIDVFFSLNSLGYIEDISAFIKHLREILQKNGRFCFYIRHSMINVTPNAILVEDKHKIRELFAKEKLAVMYHKRKRLFKEEIFIYGKKLK